MLKSCKDEQTIQQLQAIKYKRKELRIVKPQKPPSVFTGSYNFF